MINYKDLMIGNWVYNSKHTKYPMQVIGIGEDYCYLNFEGNEADPIDGIDEYMAPIEVEDSILVKAGFEKEFDKDLSKFYGMDIFEYHKVVNKCFLRISYISNSLCRDWYCQIDNEKHSSIGGFDFQYLHELQNGIRLITRGDLEIKEL